MKIYMEKLDIYARNTSLPVIITEATFDTEGINL